MAERMTAAAPGCCIQCGTWCQGWCLWCMSLLCEGCAAHPDLHGHGKCDGDPEADGG